MWHLEATTQSVNPNHVLHGRTVPSLVHKFIRQPNPKIKSIQLEMDKEQHLNNCLILFGHMTLLEAGWKQHGHKTKKNDSAFRILYTGMAPCASLQNLEYSDRNLRLVMQCFLAATGAVCQWRKPNPKNKRVQNYRQKLSP